MRKRTLSLGAIGATAAAGLAAFAVLGWSAPGVTAAQSQYAPTNTAAPTISDTTPEVEQTLAAGDGTWTGDTPMATTYQWLRCNTSGQNCVAIPGATGQAYTVQAADQGNTLRVNVTKANASGATSAQSAATSPVAPRSTSGKNVSSVNPPDRLIVDQVRFSPNRIRSRTAPFTVRVRVLDTNGRPIEGALVFLRSTPVVTTTPDERETAADGWVSFTVQPERDFSIVYRRGYNLQFFVRARGPSGNPLAGISTRRLVQVGISPS